MAATIDIYLVRHAIAGERGPAYPDDRLRPLTPAGTARFKETVAGLRELDITIDLIITSPLVRARQTAELLAAGLPGKPPIEVLDALAPAGRTAIVVDTIAKHARRRQRRLALVGHQPDLGELGSRLLSARGTLELKKGGVARIELDGATPGGPGTLHWMLPPRVLRKLGR
ncbi:MAG: phosphohistidine phosphatase SixA [Vicinamibacterales bacterium]